MGCGMLAGIIAGADWMELGTILGGVFFLAALIPLCASFFSGYEDLGVRQTV